MKRFPFLYKGSKFWLVVIAIFLPLVAITLIIKHGGLRTNARIITFIYRGDFFWLVFWLVIFSPIGAILFLLNGIDIIEDKISKVDEAVERF